jgi:hypothetical protein
LLLSVWRDLDKAALTKRTIGVEVEQKETWTLEITADDVLRGQGADPAAVKARSPRLFQLAEEALEEGLKLAQPQVVEERFSVESVGHDRLQFEGGASLKGEGIVHHLASATEIAVVVCTIGPALDDRSSVVMDDDIIRGLALYGVGSAAVEALANAVCRRIEQEAEERDLKTTIPLSPGMIGWSVEEGQPQIFQLIDAGRIDVALNPGGVMTPLKSLSMMIGLGKNVADQGLTCDYCAMKETCRHRDRR